MTTISTNTAPKSKSKWFDTPKERVAAQTKTLEFRVMVGLLTALMLWGAAIATFGYPALILVALTLVPAMFFFLLMITVGR